MSVPAGATNLNRPMSPQREADANGLEPPLSPVGDEQLPVTAKWSGSSPDTELPNASTPHDHELFTPPAPGALHDTTSYVPARATGTPSVVAANAAARAVSPRIPPRIAPECTPLEAS